MALAYANWRMCNLSSVYGVLLDGEGCRSNMNPESESKREVFVGEPITPDESFLVSSMAMGKPGLPRRFSWKGRSFSILQVVEEWKESGDCRHGSGERYVRKHWFRIRTTEELEMKIYFERQKRSSGGSRWRLYTIQKPELIASPKTPPAVAAIESYKAMNTKPEGEAPVDGGGR